MHIVNSFSINMLELKDYMLSFNRISAYEAGNILLKSMERGEFVNAIGHKTSDLLIRNKLAEAHKEILKYWGVGHRITVKFTGELIIGQYSGQRLAENTYKLKLGSSINFWRLYAL